MQATHEARKHSKFSASGAERWMNCPGSVALSEGLPDKSSVWAQEGTLAHEVLERTLVQQISNSKRAKTMDAAIDPMMVHHTAEAAKFIMNIYRKHPGSEVLVETRIRLDFIHPEMFGTFDAAVIDHFATLHVFDFKYGAGYAVNPRENLQMIFYGLGLAHLHHYNFNRVRLWIIQPRIKGYNGPSFWDISIERLMNEFLPLFKRKVAEVERYPKRFNEGGWCHWCRARSICPLKAQNKLDEAIEIFSLTERKKK